MTSPFKILHLFNILFKKSTVPWANCPPEHYIIAIHESTLWDKSHTKFELKNPPGGESETCKSWLQMKFQILDPPTRDFKWVQNINIMHYIYATPQMRYNRSCLKGFMLLHSKTYTRGHVTKCRYQWIRRNCP